MSGKGRQSLGGWGAELGPVELACALAYGGSVERPTTEHESVLWLAQLLDEAVKLDAAEAAMRWRARAQTSARIAIHDAGELDIPWLVETLASAERVASVFVEPAPSTRASLRAEPAWDWPLDIGFLDDPASEALRAAASGQYWDRFIRFVDGVRATAQVDLLLFPGSLPAAVAFARGVRLPRVHTILALGGAGDSTMVMEHLAALRARTGAATVGALHVEEGQVNRFLDALLFNLAHDNPLDAALFAAHRAYNLGSTPLLMGWTESFGHARVSRVAQVLGIKPVGDNGGLESFDEPRFDWTGEGRSATDVARAAPGARRARDASREDRYLQARVQPIQDSLVLDTPNQLDVQIGAPKDGWMGTTQRFPSERLPEDSRGHELTVVVTEKNVFPEPRVGTLWLPAEGDSTVCSFPFSTSEAVFDARVTVLYRNRILQTLRVKSDPTRQQGSAVPVAVEVEAVARSTFDGLGGTRGFDAALLLNDRSGAPGVTVFGDTATAYVNLSDDFTDVVKNMRSELEKITQRPGDFASMDSKATLELLIALARMGRGMLESLKEAPGMRAELLPAPSDPPRRLQVFSMHENELVPVELAYDGEYPDDDATLCPVWSADRARVACDNACQESAKHVCPLRFWGLRHVIERGMYDQARSTEIQGRNANQAFQSDAIEGNRPVTAIDRVLLGYASKAQNFEPAEFDAALSALKDTLSARNVALTTAGDWAAWLAEIRTTHPQLLLLMPHTDAKPGAVTLQIGDDSLNAPKLASGYVAEPPVTPPAPGPIVFLFGCRTSQNDLPFASFVKEFRRARASVVLATIGTVRGRHMAPAARLAVELLVRRTHDARASSMGEFMVDLRRTLLAKDLPVGMTLLAFGDVDWQLGGRA